MRVATARGIAAIAALAATRVLAQSESRPEQHSAWFDPDGTAHITRVVPVPSMLSPEAQQWLDSLTQHPQIARPLAEQRAAMDQWRARGSAEAMKYYPVTIEHATIAGVRTDLIMPLQMPDSNRQRVLISLHSGGFSTDSGSLIEGDPIANLTRTRVVSVYYRLAPENPFPAAVDDVVAVYRELLRTYKARSIGIFGSSAGATLSCEVAVKLKTLGMPLPGALGVFSGGGDFSRVSDSHHLFTLDGLPGDLKPNDAIRLPNDGYVGTTDRRDPLLSPVFADLSGLPPTLLVTSTRDLDLGNTAAMHRALLRDGVDARLVVFEALPHTFWYHFEFPETTEALQVMANFLDQKVAH